MSFDVNPATRIAHDLHFQGFPALKPERVCYGLGSRNGERETPNDFCGSWVNAVSNGAISVHPIGKSISASVKFGWILHPCSLTRACTLKTVLNLYRPVFVWSGIPNPRPSIDAVGVGHNEHSLSHVWSTHGARRNNRPFSIVPEAGQVSENGSDSVIKESCDVFHEDEAWSYLANESRVLSPEARSFSSQTSASACATDVLAREAPADDVDVGNSIPSKSVGAEFSNVFIDRHPRPMLRQYAPTERLDLAERHGFKPAGPFQAQRETANPAKQVENLQHRLSFTHSVLPAS